MTIEDFSAPCAWIFLLCCVRCTIQFFSFLSAFARRENSLCVKEKPRAMHLNEINILSHMVMFVDVKIQSHTLKNKGICPGYALLLLLFLSGSL